MQIVTGFPPLRKKRKGAVVVVQNPDKETPECNCTSTQYGTKPSPPGRPP
jgi:hypothetical protein